MIPKLQIVRTEDSYILVDENFNVLVEEKDAATLSTDDTGREHKGKGEGGGQFTGKEKKTSVKTVKEKLPAFQNETGGRTHADTRWVHRVGSRVGGKIVDSVKVDKFEVTYRMREETADDTERLELEDLVNQAGLDEDNPIRKKWVGMNDTDRATVFDKLANLSVDKDQVSRYRKQADEHRESISRQNKESERRAAYKTAQSEFNSTFDELALPDGHPQLDELYDLGEEIDRIGWGRYNDVTLAQMRKRLAEIKAKVKQ